MTEYDDGEYRDKSRSQKKRESTAVQKLGQALAALSKNDLQSLDLPTDLCNAILDWKSYPGHEAKRRQMQYIGRIMREMDIAAIEETLEAHLAPGRAAMQTLHEIENLRDSLVNASGSDLQTELNALAVRFPDAPLPRLRHLAETASAERAGKKPPKAYRELFKVLKELLPVS